MNIKYQWKKSVRFKKIKPEIAAHELEKIRKKRGVLKPEDVVSEARRKNHPLHDYFVWDDDEAANQYRIWQARHLISVLVVVRADDDSDEPLTVRAYAHIREEEGGNQYVHIVQGMSDVGMRERILAEALKELAGFRRKYADLKEFAALFAEMDRIAS